MNLNNNTKIRFKKNIYTWKEFKAKFVGESVSWNDAKAILDTLIKKGSAVIVDERSKEEKHFEQVAKEESVIEMANAIDAEEEAIKDKRAEDKRQGRLTYEEIEIEYPTMTLAMQAEKNYIEALRLKDTEIKIKGGVAYLVVRNITDSELNYINRTYKADKAIQAGLGFVGKTTETVTDAVDYTAQKVVAPIAQIGVKTISSLFKTVAQTTAKTGATLVRSASQGIKETAHAVANDPEIIRAQREIIEAKDAAIRKVSGLGGTNASNGIRIVK